MSLGTFRKITFFPFERITIDDDCDIHEEDDNDTQVRAMPSVKYIEQYYQDLLKCEFKQRPIIRWPGDYDLEDPTKRARKK